MNRLRLRYSLAFLMGCVFVVALSLAIVRRMQTCWETGDTRLLELTAGSAVFNGYTRHRLRSLLDASYRGELIEVSLRDRQIRVVDIELLRQFEHLKDVRIRDCQINDKDVLLLAEIESLQRVSITNSNIPPETVHRFRQLRPDGVVSSHDYRP